MRKFKAFLAGLIFAVGLATPAFAGSAHYTTSTAYESSHVIETTCSSTAPCFLYGYTVLDHSSTAMTLMIFDATSAPVDGAVTPKICVPTSGASATVDGGVTQPVQPNFVIPFTTGITAVLSIGQTCTTKTATANGWFEFWSSPS